MPSNMPEIEVPISYDSSICEYCRFAQLVHSIHPLECFNVDFDVRLEQVDGSLSDGPRERFVLYADGALWHQVMKTKDLQPELLRWYLQLKKFNFMVRDRADPDQAQNKGQALNLKRTLLGRQPKLSFFFPFFL